FGAAPRSSWQHHTSQSAAAAHSVFPGCCGGLPSSQAPALHSATSERSTGLGLSQLGVRHLRIAHMSSSIFSSALVVACCSGHAQHCHVVSTQSESAMHASVFCSSHFPAWHTAARL